MSTTQMNVTPEQLATLKAAMDGTQQTVVPYYRALYATMHDGTATTLDDATVYSLYETNGGEGTDDDEVNVVSAMEEEQSDADAGDSNDDRTPDGGADTEPTGTPQERKLKSIAAGKSQLSMALRMVGKIGQDALSEIEAAMAAKERLNVAPIVVWKSMDTSFTKDDKAEWPKPGAGKKDPVTKRREPSNNPDHYETYAIKADGSYGKVEGRFWWDFADNSPIGRTITRMIDAIRLAQANDGKAPQELLRIEDKADLKTLASRWQARRVLCRALFIKAANIHFQVEAMKEVSKVGWKFLTNADGSFVNSPKPVKLWVKAETDKMDVFSLGTFLSFDVAQAIADKGDDASLGDLKATLARGTPDDEEETVKPTIVHAQMTVDDWYAGVQQEVLWADQKHAHGRRHLDGLAKWIANADDETIETLGDYAQFVDEWIGSKVSERYQRIKLAGSKEERDAKRLADAELAAKAKRIADAQAGKGAATGQTGSEKNLKAIAAAVRAKKKTVKTA